MNMRRAGFTLIEILLVIFIMVLLTLMTLPLFSQFVKTSRVQQAANIVSTTISRARMEAMRTRKMTAIFIGDDTGLCAIQPTPGVIPPRGRIEIWTVKEDNAAEDDEEGVTQAAEPLNNQGNWYPYKDKDRCLTPEPITFPDGVRVLVGRFFRTPGPKYAFGWKGGQYKAVPDGECKRHILAFSRNGKMPGWFDGVNSWWDILVYDEATGEHLVISAGDWMSTGRPRILPYQLTTVYAVNGTINPVTNKLDLVKYIH